MSDCFIPRPSLQFRNAPTLHQVQVNDAGTRLAVTEWAPKEGSSATPPFVFLHATGFHSRCWDEVIRRLSPAAHCFAIDVRGHGESDKPEPDRGVYRWEELASEVIIVLRHFGIVNALGIGHSMGGYMVLHAALADHSFFRGVLLLDPVVVMADAYASWTMEKAPLSPTSFVARRFNRFESPEQMFSRLQGKGSYRAWCNECLADYCAYGLMSKTKARTKEILSPRGDASLRDVEAPNSPSRSDADDEGHLLLACPPHIEAATYAGSASLSDRCRYKDLQVPVSILRAGKSVYDGKIEPQDMFNASPTDPELWRLFRQAKDVPLSEGMTHFIPMQDPDLVVQMLGDLASECGFDISAKDGERLTMSGQSSLVSKAVSRL
eukprot:TRINITY_DN17755_c0_g2_i1.p1 TRINITY_DN17755_c0_g2~~TRINITY_DN17755_c0_g2_i1.p1  ORF type:complete len:379 (+),score=30.73 TRINITY_DN17755_c0_g2_i1:41-1177(+)